MMSAILFVVPLKGIFMRVRFLSPLVAAASILLSGCGEAVREPPVPLDQPLLPATIYVPDCPTESGFLGFLGGADAAPGVATCRAMHDALVTDLRHVVDRVKLVDYKVAKDAERFAVEPDKAAEASIGSKYRIVLMPAMSSRVRSGYMEYVATSMAVGVFDAGSGEQIGDAGFHTNNAGLAGAEEMTRLLAKGLAGPRCEVLNIYSLRTATHKGPECTSFILHPM